MPSDNELMAAVKNGDLEKLADLDEKYNRPLFAFFYKMTADSQASEDLVQVVFCKILAYRDRYRDKDGTFAVWLFQIARNARIDHYHKEKYLKNAADADEPGFGDFSASRLVELAIHRVTVDYIRELQALGWRNLSLYKILEFKIHGIDKAYIDYCRKLLDGKKELTPQRIIQMKIAGI